MDCRQVTPNSIQYIKCKFKFDDTFNLKSEGNITKYFF